MTKILHIEDDEVIRILGKDIFKNTGYEYIYVDSAEED
mgnify:CR=1 FL=1